MNVSGMKLSAKNVVTIRSKITTKQSGADIIADDES